MFQKSAVSALNTGEGMFREIARDLALLVAKTSAFRRLAGFRNVPGNTACISATSGAAAAWVAEGQAVPLSAGAFDLASLVPLRLSALSVTTKELARLADSEMTLAADHARALSDQLDATFFDPRNSGSPETSPASITRYAPQIVSTGSSAAAIDANLNWAVQSLVTGGSNLLGAAWCMSPITSAYLGTVRGSGGSPAYPRVGALGGELLGLPVFTSAAIPHVGSPSPGVAYIALVDGSRVWVTDSGVSFASSDKVLLQMDDAPSQSSVTGSGTTGVSMFQTDSIALLSTSWLNWRAMTHASAAASITGVAF
jgi:HK97 family phage major capsid protein